MTFSLIELQRTAVHEAGHAIMARELGLKVKEVTIAEDESRFGSCRYSGGYSWVREYAVTLAGPWAAGQWFEEDTADLTDWTSAEEILNKALEAGHLPNDVAEITRRVQELEADTQLLLEGLRPKIEKLAAELLIRQTMTGDEIEEVLRDAD